MKNIRLRFLSFDATKKPIVLCRVLRRAYRVMRDKAIFLFGVYSTLPTLYYGIVQTKPIFSFCVARVAFCGTKPICRPVTGNTKTKVLNPKNMNL